MTFLGLKFRQVLLKCILVTIVYLPLDGLLDDLEEDDERDGLLGLLDEELDLDELL